MIDLFYRLGAPGRKRFLLALLLSAIAGAAGIGLLGLSGWFLTASALAGTAGAGHVFNHLYPSAGVRGFALTRVIARYAEQLVGHDATLKLSASLRPRLFAASARSTRGFTPLPAAALTALIDDVETVEGGFLRVLSPLAGTLAAAFIAIGFAMAAHPALGAVTVFVMLFTGWVLPRRAVRRARTEAEKLASTTETERGRIANMVENAVELDVIGALPHLADEAADALTAHQSALSRIEAPFRQFGAINTVAGGVLAFLILLTGLSEPGRLAMAAGGALTILSAFDAIGAMTKVLEAAPRAGASAARLLTIIEGQEAVPSPPIAEAAPLPDIFPVTATDMVISPAKDAAEIGPFSFTLRKGSVTFLSGPSGSGKTTLLETLMRLQPVADGELHYNGVSWTECRTASVLAHLSLSPQFVAFLPGSLRAQFQLADPDISDEAIMQAIEFAGLSETFRTRDMKLDDWLTEEMAGLSGGELRRLGLARAIAADPSLLVLDEPFAGLEEGLALQLAARLTNWAAKGDRALLIAMHDPLEFDWAPLERQVIRLGS
ncbi:amino acid ABC transporter ATP-binding/permease protein [Parvularcula marina]|uniref:ATP-binding cassette domain-containing protein n=1 Tax=Parvularcula marina TaxID=2292771 RepID=A0A371REL8_9PROT|nr:ATP-binding cassette domain-containing protein [Parvularcula marina]RFB03896.1 ATP-binding cassette domain-containing protein [Parvularcula marina]